ncbi:LOW QUALITY PROTEIN: glypican-5 [Sylvia borin]
MDDSEIPVVLSPSPHSQHAGNTCWGGRIPPFPAPPRALGSAVPPPPGTWGPSSGGGGPGGAAGGASPALPAAAAGRRRPSRGKSFRLAVLTLAVLLSAAATEIAEPPPSCEAVRKVSQLRRLVPPGGVPESPRAGKAELAGQEAPAAAGPRRPWVGGGRSGAWPRWHIGSPASPSILTLKIMIAETFEMLIRLPESYTSTLFCNAYTTMAAEATVPVQEFFTDVGLFLFGIDISTVEFVNHFFDILFPVVCNHVINPGPTAISMEYVECLLVARRIIPFGNIPKKATGQIERSLLPSRTFLQALNLRIEVINATDHLHFSSLSRALLRMQYSVGHCQGLTLSKPCMGHCLNTIRGCLADVAEVDPHWRGYIQSLEELSGALSEAHSMEHVLLNFHSLVRDALVQTRINGAELLEQMNKICGPPVRKPKQSPGCFFDQNKDNQELKMFSRDSEETFANRRKEFISHLRLYRAFYSGLADPLCGKELAAADGLLCWKGEDVLRSYMHHVVGSGIKAQSANPEVQVKGIDPVISQIIDKLKHVIQQLQGKSFPKWDLQETGSGGGEVEQINSDCDDEDGCRGSGSGEFKRVLKITDRMPDKTNLSDAKQIHHTNNGSTLDTTLDTTGARCTAMADYVTFMLISLVILFLSLW